MNASRNLVINVLETVRDKNGNFLKNKHDHWINKEKHTQPHRTDLYGQDGTKLKNRATKKKFKYKKKGTGGYGR